MSDETPGSTQATGDAPLLRLDGIFKRYGAFEALSGVDLKVRTGEVVAIIGPSGSGKSTLLRCINQLEPPTSGRVALGNVVIEAEREPSRKELMQLRRSVGMVFQSFNLFPHLTVLRNVSLAQERVIGRSRKQADDAIRYLGAALTLTLRAIPPIVWLFFIFFGIGFGYLQISPFAAGAIGLGLITAANMAEIYRGALAAIHPGQWEAAFALNLSSRHRFIDVIGPQLLRVALPSGATYAIGLLKDSAISSTIGVNEIAFQAYHTSQRTFHSLDVYAIAGLLYILISLPMAWATRWADIRLRARVAR